MRQIELAIKPAAFQIKTPDEWGRCMRST